VALSGSAVSDDAKLFAYGLATAGSDWQQWKVRDVATGKIGRTLGLDQVFWCFLDEGWKRLFSIAVTTTQG
jgi:prolyl oligopeptidase PreP (S9A serine peptidase family)